MTSHDDDDQPRCPKCFMPLDTDGPCGWCALDALIGYAARRP